jgi:hypothetical protein
VRSRCEAENPLRRNYRPKITLGLCAICSDHLPGGDARTGALSASWAGGDISSAHAQHLETFQRAFDVSACFEPRLPLHRMRMNRLSIVYASLILALLELGVYEIARPSDRPTVRGIACYQLALSFCAVTCFAVKFAASIGFLIRRRPGADATAGASGELGLLYCAVLVVTAALSWHYLIAVWWIWTTPRTAALLLSFVYASLAT